MSLRPAFSTIACPEWTLEQVASAAAEWEFAGVELRTFGHGSSRMACDPGLTDPAKVKAVFRRSGVQIAGLSTGATLDAPIHPPVLGNVRWFNPHASVERAKHYVDLCHDVGGRSVRVYGFRVPERERRWRTTRRIADRLSRLCDHARHKDVSVHIENGGSFGSAADLAELLDRVESPLLRASYDVATGQAVGDDVGEALSLLGERLAVLRLSDARGGHPVAPGSGEVPCRQAVERASQLGLDGWVVFTWPRLWGPELAPIDEVLRDVAQRFYGWLPGTGAPGAADAAA